ncbi:hypothetical protein [Micromonospora sp. WMMA1947]|uniref:hypothetical protein n=1 Tax=Micromonospora sp. WMMA1947 TaxID=3015163 RepID=UPI00248C4450|nr:hypothetical protein [Micromonospora sp. WMMA1947]WBC08717.1 hypothetical protein O7604_26365 [Micromonospora sp. WMMA1947]
MTVRVSQPSRLIKQPSLRLRLLTFLDGLPSFALPRLRPTPQPFEQFSDARCHRVSIVSLP